MNNSNVPTGNGNRKLNIRMSEDVGTKIKEWNGGDEISLHTTVVNISERKREIATLKVLGFNNKEVNSYIFKEIIILTIIGAIIGLPLGVFETKFVMNVIDMDFVVFPTNVKPLSFIFSFAITIIFTFVVFKLTSKTLKDIDMIESLKSVE